MDRKENHLVFLGKNVTTFRGFLTTFRGSLNVIIKLTE